MSKVLYISNASTGVTDLLKTLAVLSDTTFRRSAVDWEHLNHTGNQKNISLGDQQTYYLQVSGRLY